MKTFYLNQTASFSLVVPDTFVKAMRAEAITGETPFLAKMHAVYPEDDDEFILAVLRNGVRISIRDVLVQQCQAAGIGIRMAPAEVHLNAPRMQTLADMIAESKHVDVPSFGEAGSLEQAGPTI